ncbi:MAG TPA: hypothetical protein VM282_21105 [Acidimicrobiales bacterium]|nr:hypothetical protein [Acidimicrobiales bacterium]
MSTGLSIRRIEESLDAVRALAELSPEGTAEVNDRVEQARSMIESLPDPIGVTEIRARRSPCVPPPEPTVRDPATPLVLGPLTYPHVSKRFDYEPCRAPGGI